MKRFFTSLTEALLTGLLIVPGASAQNLNPSRSDIPFAFVANHQSLPAGCYRVELQSPDFLALANCTTGSKIFVMVRTASGYPTVERGSLIFRGTSLGYRLIQVQFASTSIQSDLIVQKSELDRELAWNLAGQGIAIPTR